MLLSLILSVGRASTALLLVAAIDGDAESTLRLLDLLDASLSLLCLHQ
jgi:hypothetical protein